MLIKYDHKKMDKSIRVLPPLLGNDLQKQSTVENNFYNKDLYLSTAGIKHSQTANIQDKGNKKELGAQLDDLLDELD